MGRQLEISPNSWIGYTSLLVAVLFLSHAVVNFIFSPIQALILPDLLGVESLLFLPHGVEVLAVVVLRGKALAGLFAGSVLSSYFIWDITDPGLLVPWAIVGSTATWVVFEFITALRINVFYETVKEDLPRPQNILLGSLLSSVANGFLIAALFETPSTPGSIAYTIIAITIGNCAGFLLCWYLVKLTFDALGVKE